ncbi:MAG: hypothetical protein WD845_03960 [Pirellulales bacterium]
MILDWQSIASLAIVSLAIAYLARIGWRTIVERKAAACGGGCKSCAAGGEPPVVEIGALASSRGPDHR